MKHLSILAIFVIFASCNSTKDKKLNKGDYTFSIETIDSLLKVSEERYLEMSKTLKKGELPKTFENDTFRVSDVAWWCSGFYPGTLWYLYENTKNEATRILADSMTVRLKAEMNDRSQHDLGFILYCSYGNGLRLTNNQAYKPIMLKGAESLISRYKPTVGCTKSWDWGGKEKNWQCPVIIDNMMNLEFLFWAAKESGNKAYYDKAVTHSLNTMKNHYRPDFSSYHVVDYDSTNGNVRSQITHQGYSNSSAWARGQAWGLYGFAMVYRETKDEKFREHATKIAEFILNNPNYPKDGVPYWDFNAPNIPNALRDASAGAIIASALLELQSYVDTALSKKYFIAAENILKTLSSHSYFAEKGTNGNFILKHSVGHFMGKKEVDVPLTYADYYYVEALIRYKKIIQKIQNK